MSNYSETSYGKSIKDVDESRGTYQSKESDNPGNTLIYILTGLCILLFIFIVVGIFFIAKPPQARLTSITVSNLMYNKNTSSSLPLYFNATLSMEIRIDNQNRGSFKFSAGKGSIFYNGDVVGEMTINGQQVDAFGDKRTNVTTEVSYLGDYGSPVWLKNDIERKLIILMIRAKLRGEVYLKTVNKKTANLKCILHLGLKDKVIRRFWCK